MRLLPQRIMSRPRSTESMPSQRPFTATVLALVVLSILAWGVARLITSIRTWNVLIEFGSSLSPLYLSMTGAAWIAAGCVLLFGMIFVKGWVPIGVTASTLLWLLEYWVERALYQAQRSNLYFAILCSIIGMAVVSILSFEHSTKSFFTRSEEHEQPNETPDSE